MSYDSMKDFRDFTDEIKTASLEQGVYSNNKKKQFDDLVPKPYLNLIENDNLKENFTNANNFDYGEDEKLGNCDSFCGKKSPYCTDIRNGRTICQGTINLDTPEKCAGAFGGKTCKWETNEWRTCTAQCKKWGCENCNATKHTANIDELEALFNQTLRKYEQDYKSLGDPNLTQEEGERIAKKIQESNDLLLKISDELYADIQKAEKEAKQDIKDIEDTNKKGNEKLSEIKKTEKYVKDALIGDKMEHGEFADTKIRVNQAYYSYVVWFIVVLILICGITAISSGVSFPTSRPLQALLLMIVVGVGYFMFTRIWWEGQNLLRRLGAS